MSSRKRSARRPSLGSAVGTGLKWFAGTMGALVGTAAISRLAVRRWMRPAGEAKPPEHAASRQEPQEFAEPEHPAEEEIRYPDGHIEHPAVRYEKRDVRFRWVMAAVVVASCMMPILYFTVWKFFRSQNAAIAQLRQSPYPLARTPSNRLPPAPRLEPLDWLKHITAADVYERQAAREQSLNSYGTTGEKGFARIPIQEAMKLVAGQLPVRKGPAPDPQRDGGLLDAGAANAGRMYRVSREK